MTQKRVFLGLLALALVVAWRGLPGTGGSRGHAPLPAPLEAGRDSAPVLVGRGPAPSGTAGTAGSAASDEPVSDAGWLVTGRVLTLEGDQPVPHPHLRAWWIEGLRIALVAEGKGDVGGRFRLPLPALDAMSGARRTTGVLEIRASAPGHAPRPLAGQRESHVVRIAAERPPLDCTLRLVRAPSLAGRLVHEDGSPHTSGRVRVVSADETEAWRTLAQACVAPDGSFVVETPPGRSVAIEVRAPGRGTSRHGPFTSAAGSIEVGILTVRTPDTIEGIVVDEAGQPWPYARIRAARPHEPLPATDWSTLGCAGDYGPPIEALWVACDEGGRFVIPAGEHGAVWTLIYLPHKPERHDLGFLDGIEVHADARAGAVVAPAVAPQWVSARSGDRDVRVEFPGTRVCVRLTDDRGEPLAAGSFLVLGWPDQAEAPQHPPAAPATCRLPVLVDARGVATWCAAPGSLWFVELDSGTATADGWIPVDRTGRRVDFELRIPSGDTGGTLRLDVRAPPWMAFHALEVTIWTAAGRCLLDASDAAADAVFQLPAGRYNARLIAMVPEEPAPIHAMEPVTKWWTWRPRHDERFLAQATSVVITTGRVSTLSTSMEAAAHLVLTRSTELADDPSPTVIEVQVQDASDAAPPRPDAWATLANSIERRRRPGWVRVHVRRSVLDGLDEGREPDLEVHEVELFAGRTTTLDLGVR